MTQRGLVPRARFAGLLPGMITGDTSWLGERRNAAAGPVPTHLGAVSGRRFERWVSRLWVEPPLERISEGARQVSLADLRAEHGLEPPQSWRYLGLDSFERLRKAVSAA